MTSFFSSATSVTVLHKGLVPYKMIKSIKKNVSIASVIWILRDILQRNIYTTVFCVGVSSITPPLLVRPFVGLIPKV